MAGKMVPIANIVSRSEALVVASMLHDAGVIARINGEHHASVELISVALGGYVLTVPDWQYEDASNILGGTFAGREFTFSEGLQTAVIKLLLAQIGGCWAVSALTMLATGLGSLWIFATPFGLLLATPVNPQGRSEYYLSAKTA